MNIHDEHSDREIKIIYQTIFHCGSIHERHTRARTHTQRNELIEVTAITAASKNWNFSAVRLEFVSALTEAHQHRLCHDTPKYIKLLETHQSAIAYGNRRRLCRCTAQNLVEASRGYALC